MDNLIYLLGPFLLGVVGARLLGQRLVVFWIGFGSYFVTWVLMTVLTAIATKGYGIAEGTFLFGLFVSLLAGLCEESTRYLVFRRCASFKGHHDMRASTGYALGHHGMETVIVGLTLLLIYAVVKFKPDAISDPEVLKQCQAALALGSGARIYNATERLIVGFLLHACFSGVVMRCFSRAQIRWLFVAMGWHFLHNMVGFNLHRLTQHALAPKLWVAFVVLAYGSILVGLFRSKSTTAADHS